MDDCIDRLEQRLVAVERDVAVIRLNYVTMEDLHREITSLTGTLVTFACGFGTALIGITYFIATHSG